ARVDAHLAAVPAEWPRPRRALDRGDRQADRLPLVVAAHLEVVAPAVAVPDDLVAPLDDLPRDIRVPLERDRGAEDRDRHARRAEHAEQAPDAGAASVLVHRLDRQVALAFDRPRQLVE